MPELTRFQFALLAILVATVVFVGGRALRASAGHSSAGMSDMPAFAAAGEAAGPAASTAPGAGTDRPGAADATADGAAGPPAGDSVAVSGQAAPAAPAVVVVHVAGAVRRPGLYRLPAGSRVGDAVERAGGARMHADLDAVNLAARLQDGEQVLVPRRGHAGPPGPGAVSSGAATAAATPGGPEAIVDLNRATAEELDTLDGVGPAIAQKILGYRAQHGSFRSIEELAQVPGIGPKKLAAIRPRVRVG